MQHAALQPARVDAHLGAVVEPFARRDVVGVAVDRAHHAVAVDSLKNRLGALPDETLLFPGHFYAAEPSSTLGEQKRKNPYLRAARLEDFLSFMGY